jgi:alpha-ribazole phosphatase
MRWIWIRHGETEENRLGRYVGHTDPALNERGEAQADRLCCLLAGELPSAVYSSDLKRCMQTAERICSRWNLQYVPARALRELSFGRWDGKTYEEIMQMDRERAVAWYDNPFDNAPPEGESLRQLGERVDGWLDRLMSECRCGDTVVLVSHGGVIRWFQSRWLQNDPGLFWQVQGVRHGQALAAEWDGNRWTSVSIGL